jgi:hypothetical protein
MLRESRETLLQRPMWRRVWQVATSFSAAVAQFLLRFVLMQLMRAICRPKFGISGVKGEE